MLKNFLISLFFFNLSLSSLQAEMPPIVIGLNADMSSGASEGGEAIRRGALIAIDEINANGGVLGGRKLTLEIRDHRGIPARGVANVKSFVNRDRVDVILGGVHTPVIMAELPTIHELKVVYLVPWAAGTPIIENGYDPNYVFRVSVRDEYAGRFITDYILSEGKRRVALVLEQTGWGMSNEKSFKEALSKVGLSPSAIIWFNWGDSDFSLQLHKIANSDADAVVFVGNHLEGRKFFSSLAENSFFDQVAVYSHWGITVGGGLDESFLQSDHRNKLKFLQTYSFFNEQSDKSKQVVQAYFDKFDGEKVEDIFSPVGTAHAYDIVHLYALAVEKAKTTDPDLVRQAMENLSRYDGLIRSYYPPFSSSRHDALDQTDFSMARFSEDGVIIPIK